MKPNKSILVGSNVFFSGFSDFVSKDTDVLEFIDESIIRHIRFKDKCVFQWKRYDADKMIDITLVRNFPMEVGKFLVPEVINELGLTISQLKRLQPLIDTLDDKHKYEKIIYDAYIKNNAFRLTKTQLKSAYKEYKKYR